MKTIFAMIVLLSCILRAEAGPKLRRIAAKPAGIKEKKLKQCPTKGCRRSLNVSGFVHKIANVCVACGNKNRYCKPCDKLYSHENWGTHRLNDCSTLDPEKFRMRDAYADACWRLINMPSASSRRTSAPAPAPAPAPAFVSDAEDEYVDIETVDGECDMEMEGLQLGKTGHRDSGEIDWSMFGDLADVPCDPGWVGED